MDTPAARADASAQLRSGTWLWVITSLSGGREVPGFGGKTVLSAWPGPELLGAALHWPEHVSIALLSPERVGAALL